MTMAGVSICEFLTPGNVVVYIRQSAQGEIPGSFNKDIQSCWGGGFWSMSSCDNGRCIHL